MPAQGTREQAGAEGTPIIAGPCGPSPPWIFSTEWKSTLKISFWINDIVSAKLCENVRSLQSRHFLISNWFRAFNGKNGSIYFSASWKNILRHLERAALSWKSLWRKWGCGENDCVTHVSLASLVRVNVVILMEMSPQICHAPQILHQLTLTRLAKSDSCQVCMRKILILWFNAHETRWGRR